MSILDERVFDQSQPDAQALLRLVIDAYPLRKAVQTVAQSAGLHLAWIDWDGAMSDVWPDVLARAAEKQKLRALFQYVRSDATIGAFLVSYAELFARLEAAGPAGPGGGTPPDTMQPFLVNLLGSGNRRPFFDRQDLRSQLRKLEQGDSKVLVVSGPNDSGKSYTWWLIDHVSSRLDTFTPYLIDFSNRAGQPATPAEVMEEIAHQLDWKPLELDKTAQDETHARLVLSWFKGQARKTPKRWFVFDGLGAATATPAARGLVKSLAVAADKGEAGDARIVLIDLADSDPLPDDLELYVERDRITYVEVGHLKDFFRSVARDKGHAVEDAGLDLLITQLLGEGPHQPPLRLSTLGPRAVTLANEVFASVGGTGG